MSPSSCRSILRRYRIGARRDTTDGEAAGSEARRAKQAEGVEMDDTTKVELDEKTELRRTLVYFAWFIGGAAGIWLLGIVITLPLLAFLYMLVEGRGKLIPSVIMAACTYGMIWGLFEYTLEMRWPPGLLFGYSAGC